MSSRGFHNEDVINNVLDLPQWYLQRVCFKGEKHHEDNTGFFWSYFPCESSLISTCWLSTRYLILSRNSLKEDSRDFNCYLSSGGLQVWLTGASGGMRASSVSNQRSSLVFIVFWGRRTASGLSSLYRRRLVVIRIMATGDNILTRVLTLYIFSSLDQARRQNRGNLD